MVCLGLFASLLHGVVSQSLRSQASEAQLKAVKSMLDGLCDATFNLTSDGSIAANAQKLDVMLHAGTTPGSMQGWRFRDMIASDESRAGFDGAVQRCADGDPRAGDPIYIDLLASASSTLRVQMVCAQFTDLLGERCLVCGANEVHGDVGSAQRANRDEVPLLGQVPRRRKKGRGERIAGRGTPRQPTASQGDLSDSESDSGSSRSSLNNSDGGEARGDQDVRGLKCDLTVFTESLQIHSISQSCKKLFQGEVKPEDRLTDIVEDPEGLMESMIRCLEAARNSQGTHEDMPQLETTLNLDKPAHEAWARRTVVLELRKAWSAPMVRLRVRSINMPRGGFVRFYVSGTPEMSISEVMGNFEEWASQFEWHCRLSNWLERPEALLEKLERAAKDPGEEGSLGTFVLTAPGSGAPAAKVKAEVFLDEVETDQTNFYLLTLRYFRNVDAGDRTRRCRL
mmetsp:Transcript_108551/g.337267  ORF Transcript_108551/g.337267 Transcript_108551/m.337267 type:complete len:454 (-) Transcript_108551:62-1423(-)